ncbi:MAG: glycosyltransferase [Pirellulales bacterium]|nr:glycosyltransferase [Pirellulales bacterium]
MDKSLTVVLPMHNGERHLRSAVLDLLDLAHELALAMELVVVDDASTDETYETACELARVYPQLTVLRQSVRQGLSAALTLVRNHLSPQIVVVHDGISAIHANELRALLDSNSQATAFDTNAQIPSEPAFEAVGSRRFGSLRALQENMERVRRRVSSFSWIRLEKPLIPRRSIVTFAPTFSS